MASTSGLAKAMEFNGTGGVQSPPANAGLQRCRKHFTTRPGMLSLARSCQKPFSKTSKVVRRSAKDWGTLTTAANREATNWTKS